jgi:hypothetical protein
LTQLVAVILQASRIVVVVGAEEAPETGLLGDDFAAQTGVRIGFVTDEVDRTDTRNRTFRDLENQIDAVLLQRLVLRLDLCSETARLAVELENTLHIVLHPRCRKDTARLGLDLFLELVFLERFVALENHAVDDRVLDNTDNEVIAKTIDGDICEKIGREQSLQRQVDTVGVECIPGFQQQIGLDRACFDTPVSLDHDRTDRSPIPVVFLRLSRAGNARHALKREDAGRHEGRCKKLTHRRINSLISP